MRILVVSDTHGDIKVLRKVVECNDDINTIIHLGDGQDDIENIKREYQTKKIYNVCGNCDHGSTLPEVMEIYADGKKIFATHGHIFGVKRNLNALIEEAHRRSADIALYGHTHVQKTGLENGIYVMNPGSLHSFMGCCGVLNVEKKSSYAILNIEKGDISMKIFKV